MKTIATIIFIIIIGATAQAQNNTADKKVNAIEMSIVTETTNQYTITTEKQVARLYKFKNSRIKKALSFTTKRNKAKMA